ncbi:ABC transporter I family member 11, chloroplastic [Tanacetum coccineum]
MYDMVNGKWKIVRAKVAQFCGVYDHDIQMSVSGFGDGDYTQQVITEYQVEYGVPFTLVHCWGKLKDCVKWKGVELPRIKEHGDEKTRDTCLLETLVRSTRHSLERLVRDIRYRPPGTQLNLLNDVSFTLPEKRVDYHHYLVIMNICSVALTIPVCYSFGMIFGRSGSGKTTLLQLIAGLTKPTSGSIHIQRYNDDGSPNQPPVLLSPEKVGIVFQFPERYFVADNVLDEVIFGLPRQKSDQKVRELIAKRLERAITAVGLNGIPLDKNPNSLSGGYKRRLALAIQLVNSTLGQLLVQSSYASL